MPREPMDSERGLRTIPCRTSAPGVRSHRAPGFGWSIPRPDPHIAPPIFMTVRSPLDVLARWIVLLSLASCSALPGDPTRPVRGPLPGRVQHPLALSTFGFRPRSAAILPKGSTRVAAQLSYASIFERGFNASNGASFDGELGSAVLGGQWGLGSGLDLAVEVPLLYGTGGFLDSFVEAFHEVFAFPNADREKFARDQYSMSLSHSGIELYSLDEDHVGLGDIPVYLTYGESFGSGWRLALRGGLEIPIGDEGRGFGSNGVDGGVQVLVERDFERLTMQAHLGWVRVDSPGIYRRAGTRLENRVEGGLVAEFRATPKLSWITQLTYQTPFVEDFDLEEIDDPILDLGIGFARDLPGGSILHVGFQEDLIANAGPDFTALVGWSIQF